MEHIAAIVCCVLAFKFSRRIADAFAIFYSKYPIMRLSPSGQHKAREKYVKLGAILIAVVVAFDFLLRS
ncbi:MAG: hypothetical protein IKH84_02375 [Ottowia sp.]|nr:hypothetical protein [Ottowia sp.]